jgi:hypothetical protein
MGSTRVIGEKVSVMLLFGGMFVSPASQVMIYRVCLVAMGLRSLRRGVGYGEDGSFPWISSLVR